MAQLYARQSDLIVPEALDLPIAVIGAGGIGSWAVLALAKMGCSQIHVFDFDKVEKHNVASQFYRLDQVGKLKTEALVENVEAVTAVKVIGWSQRWQSHIFDRELAKPYQIIVCAVDSMEERRTIWASLLREVSFQLYIDARMGGELLRILTVNPRSLDSITLYQKGLSPEKKPHQERCTARAIVYNTFMAGGLVASLVKKWVGGEEVPRSLIFDITLLDLAKGGGEKNGC